VPSVRISKMLKRPDDIFSINKETVGEYYDGGKDSLYQKLDFGVMKFEQQNSRDHYLSLQQRNLAPEISYEKISKAYGNLGHVKIKSSGLPFEKQFPKEETKAHVAAQKARSLCSAMLKSIMK